MQPNTPPAPPPYLPNGAQSTPYDFFMNDQTVRKSPGLPGGGSTRGRIVIVAMAFVVIIIIGAIIAGVASGGGKSSVEQLRSIALQQAEISRVAGIGVERSRNAEARNLAITTQISLQSDQSKIAAVLATQKIKISAAQIAAGADKQTDTLLNDANERNQFDEVFIPEITRQLTRYQNDLQAAYQVTTSVSAKKNLEDSFRNAQLLLGTNTAVAPAPAN